MHPPPDRDACLRALRADAAAGRWAADEGRRAAAAAALALAADGAQVLARLGDHAAALESLPAGALADAVRLATLSPALLRRLAQHGALDALPGARRGVSGIALPDPALGLARAHDLGLAAILLAEDYGELDAAAGGERLAALADALAGAAFAGALAETGPGEPLRLLAMGKWGGGELNFHSDLDLQLTGDPAQRASALAALRRLRTLDGPVEKIRLDLNLRPRGKDGELLLPRAALLTYVGHWAQPWEIVAGLRVREVGGAEGEGRAARAEEWFALLSRRRPAPELLRHTLSEFKNRLEGKGGGAGGPRDLKLGPGGIREIEFLAQGLLLLEGAADDLALAGNTWRALRRLEILGVLRSHELQLLLATYARLRRLENLLQAEELLAVHDLPAALPAMARLLANARAPGAPEDSPLLQELEAARGAVRDLFELKFRAGGRLLFTAGSGEGAWGSLPLPEHQRAGLARAWTRAVGASPRLAAAEASELELRVAAAAAAHPESGPRWLDLLDALADRALGLARLRERPESLEPLALLLAKAPPAAERLIRRPVLLDELTFGADPDRLPARVAELLAGAEDPAGAAHHAAALSRFSLGAGVLAGGVDGARAARALAAADRALLAGEWPSGGAPRLLAIALGGLGGDGLTPDGDWDLVFARGAGGDALPPRALLARHAAHTAWGRLPALDLDLRPWGRDGEPVSPLGALADYLEHSAEPYERFAWLRARAVAGPGALAEEFTRGVLAPLREWRPDEPAIRALWRRVGQRAGRDFKTAAGGPLQALAGAQLARLLGDAGRATALERVLEAQLGLRFLLEVRGLPLPLTAAEIAAAPGCTGLPALRAEADALLAPWAEAIAAGAAEAAAGAQPRRGEPGPET